MQTVLPDFTYFQNVGDMKTIVQDYTYFQKNKIIYARSTTDFKDLAVGMVLEMYSDENAEDHVKEYKQWQLINHAAKTDAGLQKALERIKILYYLRDTNGT